MNTPDDDDELHLELPTYSHPAAQAGVLGVLLAKLWRRMCAR